MTTSAFVPMLLATAKMTIPNMLLALAEAFGVTLYIFGFTLLGALPLGMLVLGALLGVLGQQRLHVLRSRHFPSPPPVVSSP